jgi:hypothetical protein
VVVVDRTAIDAQAAGAEDPAATAAIGDEAATRPSFSDRSGR